MHITTHMNNKTCNFLNISLDRQQFISQITAYIHLLLIQTDLLEQLHWLPIEWQIKFKLASSTYKAIHASNSP